MFEHRGQNGRDATSLMADTETLAGFKATVAASPLLAPVLSAWDQVALPDAWLVAGALAQTVWNRLHGFPPRTGIADIDLVYHDAADLSETAEARHAQRIGALFRDLPLRFDVKNEARVHLWYARKFGHPIEPYPSSEAAIASFPTTATAVGLRPGQSGYEVAAPCGLGDLMSLIVRPNKRQITEVVYDAKVARWRQIWPKLTVLPWEETPLPRAADHPDQK